MRSPQLQNNVKKTLAQKESENNDKPEPEIVESEIEQTLPVKEEGVQEKASVQTQEDFHESEEKTLQPEKLAVKADDEVSEKPENESESAPAVEKEEVKKAEVEVVETQEEKEKPIFAEKKESFFYKNVPDVKPDAPLKIEEEVAGENEELPQIEKSNKKLFMLGFFAFVITVAITFTAGILILNSVSNGKKEVVKEKPVVATPSPTSAVSVSRSEWSFEVLNGSTTPGLAAKGSEKVKALGYKVVKVGNSDDTVDTTQILVSSDATDSEKDFILEDLKKDFGNLSITDTLSGSKKTVRIILAK